MSTAQCGTENLGLRLESRLIVTRCEGGDRELQVLRVWGEADLREWRPNLAAPRGTVLDPFKVDSTEGRQREARQAKVIVLIHTQ